MRQQEKMPPRAVDAAIKNSQNSGIARSVALLAIFFISCAGRIVALDPTSHISQYGHSVWRVQDGYFGGMPNSITQTTDGYIWVGTDAGHTSVPGRHKHCPNRMALRRLGGE